MRICGQILIVPVFPVMVTVVFLTIHFVLFSVERSLWLTPWQLKYVSMEVCNM